MCVWESRARMRLPNPHALESGTSVWHGQHSILCHQRYTSLISLYMTFMLRSVGWILPGTKQHHDENKEVNKEIVLIRSHFVCTALQHQRQNNNNNNKYSDGRGKQKKNKNCLQTEYPSRSRVAPYKCGNSFDVKHSCGVHADKWKRVFCTKHSTIEYYI